MIPHRLQIKNFLSYGSEIQTIDFTPYQLICLSGKNGHGKSALLDAITWAVWGNARKIATMVKADQGLLRLGQKQMMVTLDVEISGQLYRIKREFTIGQTSQQAILEFGIFDHASQTFLPLTDKTVRTTQDAIEKVVGLSYDAFANSAFLRQGQSNEFSKKSAKDRKQILADILGLTIYEDVRRRSLEKIREQQQTITMLDALLARMNSDLEKKSAIVEYQEQVTKALTHHEQILITLDEQRQQLEHKHQQLQIDQNRCFLLQEEKKKVESAHQQTIEHFTTHTRTWRTVQRTQKPVPDKLSLLQHREKVATLLAHHQHALQQTLSLKEQQLMIKEQLIACEQMLRAALAQKNQTISLEHERAVVQQQAIAQEIKAIDQQIESKKVLIEEQTTQQKNMLPMPHVIAAAKQTLMREEKQFDKRKSYYHQYVAQGNVLRTQIENIRKKQQFVGDDANPCCPLCQQNLSLSRKRFLKNEFHQEHHTATHRINRLKKIVEKLKEMLVAQHAAISEQKQAIQTMHTSTQTATALGTALTQASEELQTLYQKKAASADSLADLTKLIAESAAKKSAAEKNDAYFINSDPAYQVIKKELDAIDQAALNTTYDQQAHHSIMQDMKKIEEQLAQCETADAIREAQRERKKRAHEINQQAKQLRIALAQIDAQLSQFGSAAKQIVQTTELIDKINSLRQHHQKERELLLQRKGLCEAQLQKLQEIEQEACEKKEVQKAAQLQLFDYQTIADATGKDGIQALLIEEAIPEIEQEANRLLAKLTDNQAQLFIESLRDLKKGGSKETLDIKISDAAGIRPYEMFSGGEAFRIDFSLRIAISRLLARRAGAALQTLIIDEGFGSQDEDGLNHIMDAIYRIQDDFCKVIIVSHLPTMKDQFPVHFFVHKGPMGSTVRVIEQD